MHLVTDAHNTVKISTDPSHEVDGITLAAAEMIIIDTPFGNVEVTICNGAVVVELTEPDVGQTVRMTETLQTSLADAFSSVYSMSGGPR